MRTVLVAVVVFVAACSSAAEPAATTSPPAPVTTSPPASTVETAPPSTAPPTTLAPLDADLVLYGGTVITMDPESSVVSGVALKGNRIVAVGDGSELANRSPDAQLVDLTGRTVIPGIVDPHIHLEQNQSPDIENMLAEERMLVETGRTTVGVPAIIPFNLVGYHEIRDSGRALLRNHLYLSVNEVCGEAVDPGWWRDYTFDRSAELRVTYAGVKLFADGGACNTPAFTFEFEGTTGDLYVEASEIADLLRQADQAGALAVVHAIGDRAVIEALEGFEAAVDGENTNRHRIDHNSLVPEDQVGRYGEVGANFVGWGWFDSCLERDGSGWASLDEGILGELRTHRPVREANPEITVAWHSDAPFTPTNVFEQLLSLTTFISLDEDGQPCDPPEWILDRVVDMDTALRMMTIDAAAVMDLDADLGSIEVGKIADLAILESNPFDHGGLELLDNRVVSTWIDGKAAFCIDWAECDTVPWFGEVEVAAHGGYTASASRSGHGPEKAFDGSVEGESFWSSGDDAPGWIEAEFDTPRTVEGLRLVVFQNPEGDTLHVVELKIDGTWSEVERFEGATATGEVLEWTPAEPVEGVEGFRVTTLESVSWPEWYEIEVVE